MKTKKLLKKVTIEAKDRDILPLNFRTTKVCLPENPHFKIEGLNELKLIGSAQFSEKQLKLVKRLIDAPIAIFDLRLEYHGFIDGNAVTDVPGKYATHILTEQEIVTKTDLQHCHIPIVDGHPATVDQVRDFITTVLSLDNDTWVWVHCAHGHGRTTTFMAIYDMLHNSHKVSLKDIVARQNLLGGINLFDLPNKTNKDYQDDVEREKLLKTFYNQLTRSK